MMTQFPVAGCRKIVSGALFMCMVAAMSPGAAQADVIYDATTGFVTLLRNDTSSTPSLAAAGNWSDGLPPHADPPTNYYVAAGLTLMGPAENVTFPSPLYVAGIVLCRGDASNVDTFSDLRILPGGALRYDNVPTIAGRITFISEDSENPSEIRYTRNSNTHGVKLKAKVVGAKTSQAKFYSPGQYVSHLALQTGADWSEFEGTLRFEDGFGTWASDVGISTPGTFAHGSNAWMLVAANRACSFGNLSFGGGSAITNSAAVNVSGSLEVGANTYWRSVDGNSRVSKVGTFAIGDGASFSFAKGSGATEVFHVTNGLTIGSGVKMSFDVAANMAAGEEPSEYTVFRLSPEAVATGLPDFSSVSARMNAIYGGALPSAYMVAKDDPDVADGKIAVVTHKKIVKYVGSGDQTVEANHVMDSDVDQTGVWEDGQFPHAGIDYYLPKSANIAFRAKTSSRPNRATTFPGDKLCLQDLSVVYLYSSTCISNLHVYMRSAIYPRESCRLSGKLTIHHYDPAYISSAKILGDRNFQLDSEIDGDGDLEALSYYPASTGATLFLNGVNTNWTGGILTTWTRNSSSPNASTTAHVRVVVGDGRSLGGTLSAFRHDSLKLRQYAELRVTNSTMFAEATRGVLISANGEMNIDNGMVATFAAPLTLDGVLRKTGGGVLALSAPVRFGLNNNLSDATAPTEGRNLIRVEQGGVKIGSCTGVKFSLAADGCLVVGLDGPIVNTSGENPFESDDGVLRVAPDGAIDKPESKMTMPLLTVASDVADAVEAMLVVTPPWRGVKARIVREDGATTTTFKAMFEPKGFVAIFQ